jgi:hypothetical protein
MRTSINTKSIISLLLLSSVSFCFKDNCGSYRWFVKTLTDAEGAQVFTATAVPSSIDALTNETRSAPDTEKDPQKRYADEKKVVKMEVTISEIKMEGDKDFHIVLSSGNKTMVGEVPDGDCGAFANHPDLKKHFNDLRTQIMTEIGFTPGSQIRPVNKKAIIEGVPFWDEISAGHIPTGSAKNQHEIHPIIKITFSN